MGENILMTLLKKIFGLPWRIIKALFFNSFLAPKAESSDQLVFRHFQFWSSENHPSLEGMLIGLRRFENSPIRILETGTSAWGTDSTRLFDSYVRIFGGVFNSVDLREEPGKRLRYQLSAETSLYVDDSVEFIKQLHPDAIFDFIYLDSFDVDWDNPEPSALHGLMEIETLLPHLANFSIVIIDDTPASFEFMDENHQQARTVFKSKYDCEPGKGGLILNFLERKGFNVKVLHHSQNLVLEIHKP